MEIGRTDESTAGFYFFVCMRLEVLLQSIPVLEVRYQKEKDRGL